MFETAEDTNQKLANSVILYNRKPIWVASAGNDSSWQGTPAEVPIGVFFYDLPLTSGWESNKKKRFARLSDPLLDYRAPNGLTGYVNYFGKEYTLAVYISRMPIRLSVQGLHGKNVHIHTGVDPITGDRIIVSWNSLLSEKSFCDLFDNKYPSLEHIREIFEKKSDKLIISLAFHRFFAISKGYVGPYYLDYHGQTIGWSKQFNNFELDSKFNHLKEALEYHNIACKSAA